MSSNLKQLRLEAARLTEERDTLKEQFKSGQISREKAQDAIKSAAKAQSAVRAAENGMAAARLEKLIEEQNEIKAKRLLIARVEEAAYLYSLANDYPRCLQSWPRDEVELEADIILKSNPELAEFYLGQC